MSRKYFNYDKTTPTSSAAGATQEKMCQGKSSAGKASLEALLLIYVQNQHWWLKLAIPNLEAQLWKSTDIGSKNVVDENLETSATHAPTAFFASSLALFLILKPNLVSLISAINVGFERGWAITSTVFCGL